MQRREALLQRKPGEQEQEPLRLNDREAGGLLNDTPPPFGPAPDDRQGAEPDAPPALAHDFSLDQIALADGAAADAQDAERVAQVLDETPGVLGLGAAPPVIQPALRVNAPDDAFEREADAVADLVTRPAPDGAPGAALSAPPDIQRSGAAAGVEVTPEVEAGVAQLQGGGAPLPDAERDFFEQRMGADFGDVRVHNDEPLARDLGARAFTVGSDIAFDSGEYQPGTDAGRHLLAHELTHVVQQAGGIAAKRIQRQPGDSYDDGNRPDPSTGTSSSYEIVSDSPRILTAGSSVTYNVQQSSAAGDQAPTCSWRVVNDPQAAAQHGLPATLEGHTGLEWTLRARVPGVHRIQATIEVGGATSQLEYVQQVVTTDRSYAAIGSGVAPAAMATINDFIAIVERIEAAYGGLPWQDVASRIRMEFYPGPGGGAYSGLMAAFTWDDLIDEQENVPPLQAPPVALADIAGLRQRAEIATPQGQTVDIGHVLTGLDSMNFPNTAGLFSLHKTAGPAAATWSGDVGSALVHYAGETFEDNDGVRQRYYDDYSSLADLLGDFDGIAVADMSGVPDSAPLSERLRRYYVTDAAQGAQRRYHNFCQVSGFGVANNRLDDAARAYIREQVYNFARAFNIKGTFTDALLMSGEGGYNNFEYTTMARMAQHLDWFVQRFIQDVEAGLSSEAP